MLRRKSITVGAACSFFLSFHAHAVTTNWTSNFNGTFTNAAYWDNGVPDSDDTAVFNRGFVAYEVNFPGGSIFDPPPNYPIEYLRVNTNEVSFVYTESPFVTIPSLSVLNPDVSIVIGENAGDVSILNMAISRLSGANASIGRAAGANGTLNVGGAFNLSGALNVGESGTGTMNVTGDGMVASTDGFIGANAGSNGQVTVSGANSQWINSNFLNVGNEGTGTLTIQDGGSVSSDSGTIGFNTDTNCTVTVTGAGSTWSNSGGLTVGFNGRGAALMVEAGGSVSNQDGTIGSQPGSNGSVTVTGAGSTWSNSGSLFVGNVYLFGGGSSTGTLTIEAGGSVSNEGIGTISGSNSTVTVTGANSTWTNSGDLLIGSGFLGGSGSGTLTIEAGGSVSNQDGTIGSQPGSNGTVTVTGAGSTWNNSGALTIGADEDASGTLIVSGGGAVSVGGTLSIDPTGIAAGNGTLSATVVNRGIVSPGLSPGVFMGVSPGALDVDGSYVQEAAGKLQLRLAGTTPGSDYDQLQVSGAVTLNGTLSVALANFFTPSAGDEFDILDWGSLSGTFDTLQLPTLSGGIMWNASQLYTAGILAVTLAGDYNANGVVDAADYIVWRKTLGQTGTGLAADGNGSGEIDNGDLVVWRANFGLTAGSGNGSVSGAIGSASAAVPEPSSNCLFCCLVISVLVMRRFHCPDRLTTRATWMARSWGRSYVSLVC